MTQVTQHIWIDRVRTALEAEGRRPLIEFLQRQRWFGGKGRSLVDVRLSDAIVLSVDPEPRLLAIIAVEYRGGDRESYAAPLSIRVGTEAVRQEAVVELRDASGGQWVNDATKEGDLWKSCLGAVSDDKTFLGESGCVVGRATTERQGELAGPWSSVMVLSVEQSNTSVVFDRRVIMKLIRKVEMGLNPEGEILEFLTTQTSCADVPPLLGVMTYDSGLGGDRQVGTLALVERFVPNKGDGWSYVLKALDELMERAGGVAFASASDLMKSVRDIARNVIGDIGRLGEVTGNLHLALATQTGMDAFRPEQITSRDCEDWREGMVKQLVSVSRDIRALSSDQLSVMGLTADEAGGLEAACWKRFEDVRLLAREGTVKIRHHGDYHLGQVLKTDTGFVVIDFEGEPARPLDERRRKVCPLKDIAGMLRSFSYAAQTTLKRGPEGASGIAVLAEWERAAREAFLDGYRSRMTPGHAMFLPVEWTDALRVLRAYELDKAIYELRYELRNRPEWAPIPLEGIRRLTREAGG